MIIAFPIRIRWFPALLFASLLALVQLLEQTDPRYVGLVFTFVLLSVLAFNVAGGLSRPSGSYILWFSLLAVLAGTVWKAILGQAADSNLEQPLLLMSAHNAIMAGMVLAAYISRKIATTQDGMAAVLNVKQLDYGESAVGCLILYAFLIFSPPYLPGAVGLIVHGINIVNPFLALAILFGTIGAVRSSGGRRSTTPLTIISLGYIFWVGLMACSKQGMFTPLVTWLVGVAWARFRLRLKHILAILFFAIYAQIALVPLSNSRDDIVDLPPSVRWDKIVHLLTHPAEFRSKEPYVAPNEVEASFHYYRTPQGIWDRLTMLPNDSVLMSFSDKGHYYGLKGIGYYYENWVPHILDPHKLEGVYVGGNAYMHEMGMIPDEDVTTGISFSPTAEAYHLGGWLCVILISPFIFALLFVTTDWVCGDLRRQPWGVPVIILFAHVAPEGGLGAAISVTWLGNVGTCIAIFGCGYITPLLGTLLSSGAKLRDEGGAFVPTPKHMTASALEGS